MWGGRPASRQLTRTALHLAADNGHAPCVESLLKARADASLKDKDGQTALDIAKERKHTEVIGILENAPADAAQATKPTAKMASATKPAAAKRPAVKKTVAKKTIAKNPAAAKKKPVAKGGCGPLARHGRRKPTEPIVPPRRRPLTTRTTTSSTSRPENS